MGRQIDLGNEEVTIGRADTCTLCVNTDQVSRRHATVQRVLGRPAAGNDMSTAAPIFNDPSHLADALRNDGYAVLRPQDVAALLCG